MGSKVHDHQCGLKGFNKKSVMPLLDIVHDNHWFWDTELLMICQKCRLQIGEFPVTWLHNGGNNLNASKVKVFKDAKNMGIRRIKLKYRIVIKGLPGHTDLLQNALIADLSKLKTLKATLYMIRSLGLALMHYFLARIAACSSR